MEVWKSFKTLIREEHSLHILQHVTAPDWFYSLVIAAPVEVSLLVVSKEDGNDSH